MWHLSHTQPRGGWYQTYFRAVDGMQGREKGVVIISLVRNNNKGTRMVKRTSRYERAVSGSQEINGCIVYEQVRCQNFGISHSALGDETGVRLYTFAHTLHLLLLLCINTKLPLGSLGPPAAPWLQSAIKVRCDGSNRGAQRSSHLLRIPVGYGKSQRGVWVHQPLR